MKLVFTDLVPEVAGDPCEHVLPLPEAGVVLMDHTLTVSHVAAGALAGIALALEQAPDEVALVASSCTPEETASLLRALRNEGYAGPITVATLDGALPQALALDGVRATVPDAIEPAVLPDFGAISSDLYINGVVFTDDPPLFLQRPDRLHVGDDTAPADVAAFLAAHMARCERAFGGVPLRARRVTVDGHRLWRDRETALGTIAAIREAGFVLGRVQVRGGGMEHEVEAALAALQWELDRPTSTPVEVVLPHDGLGGTTVDRRSLARLFEHHRAAGGLAVRRLDDAARRMLFAALRGRRHDTALLDRAAVELGAPRTWIRQFRDVTSQSGLARVIAIPTWQCELRCKYCWIPKQDGREMTEATAREAVDLLLSSEQPDCELHFFGGEPFLRWELLKNTILYGAERSRGTGQHLRFRFTTNGVALTEEMVDWLADHPVRFQVSLDGDADVQRSVRPLLKGGDSYALSPARAFDWFAARDMDVMVVQVVHPSNVDRLAASFAHIAGLGYRRIQVNFAYGVRWGAEGQQAFAKGLSALGEHLATAWSAGDDVVMVNLEESLKRIRTNLHPAVDWDGSIYAGNNVLYLRDHDAMRLGHVDDGACYHRYMADGIGEDVILDRWFREGMAANNQQMGAVMTSFVRYMRKRHPEQIVTRAKA